MVQKLHIIKKSLISAVQWSQVLLYQKLGELSARWHRLIPNTKLNSSLLKILTEKALLPWDVLKYGVERFMTKPILEINEKDGMIEWQCQRPRTSQGDLSEVTSWEEAEQELGCSGSTGVPYQQKLLSEWVTPGDTAIPGMTSLKDWDFQHSSALAQSPKGDIELQPVVKINLNSDSRSRSNSRSQWYFNGIRTISPRTISPRTISPGQHPPDNIPPRQYPPGQYPPWTISPSTISPSTVPPPVRVRIRVRLGLGFRVGGTVEGGYCPGDIVQGGYCPGGYCPGDVVRGMLSGGILSGGYCPRTYFNTEYDQSQGQRPWSFLSFFEHELVWISLDTKH